MESDRESTVNQQRETRTEHSARVRRECRKNTSRNVGYWHIWGKLGLASCQCASETFKKMGEISKVVLQIDLQLECPLIQSLHHIRCSYCIWPPKRLITHAVWQYGWPMKLPAQSHCWIYNAHVWLIIALLSISLNPDAKKAPAEIYLLYGYSCILQCKCKIASISRSFLHNTSQETGKSWTCWKHIYALSIYMYMTCFPEHILKSFQIRMWFAETHSRRYMLACQREDLRNM
jgi:hypothetical protein